MSASQTANHQDESSSQAIPVTDALILSALITPLEILKKISVEDVTLPNVDAALEVLAALPNLSHAVFNRVKLEGEEYPTITAVAPHLEILEVTGAFVSRECRTVNAGIVHFIRAPNLEDLSLSHPLLLPFWGFSDSPIRHSTHLRNLSMTGLLLPSARTPLSVLEAFPHLETWYLCRSEVDGRYEDSYHTSPNHTELTTVTLDGSSAASSLLRWLSRRPEGLAATQVVLECDGADTVWDLDPHVWGSVRDVKMLGHSFADVSVLCCLDAMREIETLSIKRRATSFLPESGKITDNLWSFIVKEDLLMQLKALHLDNLSDITSGGLTDFVRRRSARKQGHRMQTQEAGGPLVTLEVRHCSQIGPRIIEELEGWDVIVDVEA